MKSNAVFLSALFGSAVASPVGSPRGHHSRLEMRQVNTTSPGSSTSAPTLAGFASPAANVTTPNPSYSPIPIEEPSGPSVFTPKPDFPSVNDSGQVGTPSRPASDPYPYAGQSSPRVGSGAPVNPSSGLVNPDAAPDAILPDGSSTFSEPMYPGENSNPNDEGVPSSSGGRPLPFRPSSGADDTPGRVYPYPSFEPPSTPLNRPAESRRPPLDNDSFTDPDERTDKASRFEPSYEGPALDGSNVSSSTLSLGDRITADENPGRPASGDNTISPNGPLKTSESASSTPAFKDD